MSTPKLGILVQEEKALFAARSSDPVSLVVLRSTLINPPRAAAARALAERVRAVHPQAAIVPYAWHLVTHGPEDGVRELGTRALPGEPRRFGHLQDTPEVRDAWQTSLRCAQELAPVQAEDGEGGEKEPLRVVLRTPASFTPGSVGHARLTAFAAARAAEGVELVWEAEGLWEPAQTLALARKLAMQTIVPAFDGTGRPFAGSLERRWLRVDGAGPTDRLRGVLAESLAFAVEGAEDIDAEGPVVLFGGPRAYTNLRSFARELALMEPEDDATLGA